MSSVVYPSWSIAIFNPQYDSVVIFVSPFLSIYKDFRDHLNIAAAGEHSVMNVPIEMARNRLWVKVWFH